MYKQDVISKIIYSVLAIIIGLLFCFTDPNEFLRFIFAGIGLIFILLSIPGFVSFYRIEDENDRKTTLLYSIILVVIGLSLMIYPGLIINIIAGALLIAYPIYKIVKSRDKKEAFKKQIINIALGVLLILCGIGSIVGVILYVVGGLFILLGLVGLVYYIILLIIIKRKEDKQRKESEVIDV